MNAKEKQWWCLSCQLTKFSRVKTSDEKLLQRYRFRHGRQSKWLCWHQKVPFPIRQETVNWKIWKSVKQLLQLSVHSLWPHSPVENGQLPDPANWGVADVVNYFKATGFEEQATAFQDQVGVLFLLKIPVSWRKQTRMSVKYFCLHLTGNRWQVPAPDDT